MYSSYENAEVLLRGNPKAALAIALVSGLVSVAAIFVPFLFQANLLSISLAVILGGVGLAIFWGSVQLARKPRLALTRSELWVYLWPGRPERVPLRVVEVFFRGQGPVAGARLDCTAKAPLVTAADVVVRLAEADSDWHNRPAIHPLGVWQDGYITLRGLWCEPLSDDVFGRLNSQLVQAKRSHGSEQTTAENR